MKPLILLVVIFNIFLQVTSTGSSSAYSSSYSSYQKKSSVSRRTERRRTTPPPCTTTTEEPCENTCGKFEIYVECPFGACVPKTCDDVGYPVPCPDLLPNATCPDEPGCICKEGYVRNKSGICIRMIDCPSCGGDKKAISGCSNCNRLCSNYEKPPESCADNCPYNSCQCRRGYAYDEIERKCVLPKQCSKLECTEPNQVYDPCPAPCPLRTCGINDAAVSCVPALTPGDPDCAPPKCRCKDGFYKNDVGQCVTWEECPDCPGVNEIYDPCRAPCPPQRCDVDITLILCQVSPVVGDPDCDPGCRCIDGYVRNYTGGICIPREECPQCPPNQVYDICIAPCPPRRCDVDESVIRCAAPPQPGDPDCVEGCRCIDGYVKDYNDVCIPRDQCPECPGVNEIYDPCRAPCPPQRCDVDITLILCQVSPVVGDPDCDPGCRCIDGYVRNYTGICIPREQCPQCPPNQVYDICIAPCPPRRCDIDESVIRCAAPPQPGDPDCVEGCRCIDGYVKDYNDVCIPRDQCPQCTNPHEVYDPCPPSTCPPPTCENVNKKYNCPNIPVTTGDSGTDGQIIQTCEGQCVCEKGYFRNIIGECISKENCLKCTGPHEYFSCGPACDNECALIDKQNQTNCPIVNVKCNDMCYCEEGYARDENKICIPIEKCNVSCGGDRNATSGCGVNCNKRCRDIGKEPGACIYVCYENAYDCKDGYYLDENTDQCVLPQDCTPVCPINEIYSTCTQAECRPKKCSQLGFPVPCPRIDPQFCKKGCVCRQGFVRDKYGVCIPVTDCPSCGGDRNAKSGCGINCNRRCSDIGQEPGACITLCIENACDCKDGYYYDEITERCVLAEDCPQICNKNEYLNNCSNSDCSPQSCTEVGFPVECEEIGDPAECTRDCLCNDGYVRNNKGICVPARECPSCGGDPNAISGCGGYCNQKCSNIGKEPEACILICYVNSCDCREGYFYDEVQGRCVLPEDCTPECPKNEYYSTCTNGDCSVQKCSQVGFPISCPRIDPRYCKKGCLCKEGYARNNRGVCVPINKCPTCKGDPNRVPGCGVYCNQRCIDFGQEPNACIEICYENSCDCKPGYYLDEVTDQCVLPEYCTPICPENEYYNNCTNNDCSPQNCTEVGFPLTCPVSESSNCKAGCLCNEGFSRDENGVCVPINQCPTCKGDPNRVPGCGVYCNQRCSDIGQQPGPCILICYVNACDCKQGYYLDENTDMCVLPEDCTPTCSENEVYSECVNGGCDARNCSQLGRDVPCVKIDPRFCIRGCVCKEGYLRNSDGVCVPESECNPPICPENEYYNNCTNNDCSPQNCTEVGFPLTCPVSESSNCKAGCLCNERFSRDENGVCVPINQCPTCKGDPNRVPGCGVYCNQRCSDIGQQPGPCILICYVNACDCKQGYYLDENTDMCVLPEDCTPTCSENEVYSECVNGGCDARNCSQLGRDVPCVKIDPRFCIRGCVCKEGYLRNSDGVCVPESECNPQCLGLNEEYNPCPYDCPPNTCESLGRVYNCPIMGTGEIICTGRCVCKQGFYRNKIGDCICEADCLKCMGPNEFFSCGGACDNVCATLKKQNQTNCPIINIQCNRMCYCEENYARARNNTCIPIDRCQEPQCGVNEYVETCPQKLSGPFCCSQLGYPVKDNSQKPCGRSACVCIDGYVRNKQKVCIPKEECPSCGGDKNAMSGCGVNCGKLCQDAKNPNRPSICPRICKVNACDCRDGFYYDGNTNMCVPAEKCSPICGENEEYDSCSNGGCEFRNCSQLGTPQICIDPIKCNKGCKCKSDYLRLNNGTCVPVETCPEAQCQKNERFEKCPLALCQPLRCDDLGYPVPCPDISPGDYCPGGPGCICIEGYVRDQNGMCIPTENCPSCGGDPYARSGCGVNCGTHCDDVFNITRPCLRICYPNACDCIEGYFYDEVQEKCVPAEKCTPPCTENEVRDFCVNGYCGIRNCSQIDGPILCVDPIECEVGCTCKEGYLREDSTGECVPECECSITPSSCSTTTKRSTDSESPPVNATTALANFQKGNNDLSIDFLCQLVTRRPGESFMFSAFSVLIALAQLALYAIGVAYQQLMAILNLKSKEEIRTVFPLLIENYRSQDSVTFDLYIKYYSNIDVPLSDNFKKEAVEVFDSEGESIDFSENVEAARIINEWVAGKTNNLIRDLVNADMFSEDTRFVLVNALYFFGNWDRQFNPNDTTPRDFYIGEQDTDVISIPTMYQRGSFKYSENEEFDCQILQLPYKGGNFTIDFYLPNKRTGLEEMVKNIKNSNNFAKSRENLQFETVEMYIPRYSITTDLSDLTDLLKMANLTAPFEPGSDELKGIFKDDKQNLYISDTVQKSHINVTETGTEAAVATAIGVRTTSVVISEPRVYIFDFNHPGAFFLNLNDDIILCGVFTGKSS